MIFSKNSNMLLISTQCKSCDSSAIRFKLFNKFEIDKSLFIGLACGIGISASVYLIYRIWKFNKNLNSSINSINTLTHRLEYIILDLTHIDEARIGVTEQLITKRVKKEAKSLPLPVPQNESTPLSSSTTSLRKSTSLKSFGSSNASVSDYFETPLTSPQGSDDSDDDQFKDPIEEDNDQIDVISNSYSKPLKSVLKNRKVEDNILLLLHQSVEYLKELVERTENEYREVMFFFLI